MVIAIIVLGTLVVMQWLAVGVVSIKYNTLLIRVERLEERMEADQIEVSTEYDREIERRITALEERKF